ncbi:MAG: alkyl hydroperoxide reductase subunit F [Halobacteriovoraceae bacterium]|nr:alkyl hydroperoxide reductase subunit F [Halobacteriovoraceae bacterium]|tara:strand:- start:251204 stop:252751 length:1548 start_codon:yes stop_codon:yes gene_type:complete
MIDTNMLNQLKEVFKRLENTVELVYDQCDNSKQEELVDMLSAVAKTSEKINVRQSDQISQTPRFRLRANGAFNGVVFSGIPGGHEFSSLVLAILNSDKKGKLPDESIIGRIQRLKGPIRLRTFISLSCENCPEVVQTLNLMAIFHPDFQHEMVDGAFSRDEVESLNIQSVPSVVQSDGRLLSAGKTGLGELLSKLEDEFGSSQSETQTLGDYDVVVVGGGPAGASAAIYSARKGLKTAIIAEKIGGQVQDTKGIENLISVTYTEGPQLSAQLAKHIAEYDIQVLEHRRVKNVVNDTLKTVDLDSGERLNTKALIVTTGAKWRELGVPGEKEYIGRGVAYCPHCDGPMYKGKNVAVVGGGNSGVEAAIDLSGIVNSVTLLEFGPELKADQVLVEKAKSIKNISIITNAKSTQILGDEDKVVGLEYEDLANKQINNIEVDGVFVQIGLAPNSGFVRDIVETNRFGEIETDEKCKTSVEGIYAAGDVTTTPYKQIIIAMGEGAKAALAAFEDLTMVNA